MVQYGSRWKIMSSQHQGNQHQKSFSRDCITPFSRDCISHVECLEEFSCGMFGRIPWNFDGTIWIIKVENRVGTTSKQLTPNFIFTRFHQAIFTRLHLAPGMFGSILSWYWRVRMFENVPASENRSHVCVWEGVARCREPELRMCLAGWERKPYQGCSRAIQPGSATFRHPTR